MTYSKKLFGQQQLAKVRYDTCPTMGKIYSYSIKYESMKYKHKKG